MNGMTVALFKIVDIQNEQLKLYGEQVKLLKEQNNFLLEEIKRLDAELYNKLMA